MARVGLYSIPAEAPGFAGFGAGIAIVAGPATAVQA
jgi:hypothetical protein